MYNVFRRALNMLSQLIFEQKNILRFWNKMNRREEYPWSAVNEQQ